MKTRLLFITIVLILTCISQDCILAQETKNTFHNVLQIDKKPMGSEEFKSFANTKDHEDHEVIVKRTESQTFPEMGYIVFIYYMQNDTLRYDWIASETKGSSYNQLHYNWDPEGFTWQYVNTETGEKSDIIMKEIE